MADTKGSNVMTLNQTQYDLMNEEGETEKYLTFFIDDTLYAISSFQVLEILRYQKLTKIPKMPEFVKGVVNIRGKIIPVMDLSLKMGKASAKYTEQSCLILVEQENIVLGLVVDKVNDVSNVEKSGITIYSNLVGDKGNEFILGICKTATRSAMILNVQKVLAEDSLVHPL